MIRKKGKTSQGGLTELQNINNPRPTGGEYTVEIRFVKEEDRDTLEKVKIHYLGKLLHLKAFLGGKWAGQEKDVRFDWTTNPEFEQEVVKENGEEVYIQTNAIDFVPDSITSKTMLINLSVKASSDQVPYGVEDEIEIHLRLPGLADLKANFDEKMDEIVGSIEKSNLNDGHLNVSLTRTAVPPTEDILLWTVIRRSTQAIGFNNYADFIDLVLFGNDGNGQASLTPKNDPPGKRLFCDLQRFRAMPFNDTDAYRLLKVATEAFLLVNAGIKLSELDFNEAERLELNRRMGTNAVTDVPYMNRLWKCYLNLVAGTPEDLTLPYLALLSEKFRHETFKNQFFSPEALRGCYEAGKAPEEYLKILRNKLTHPFLLELIWSYWHEEGMLVQTMNAISRRFQNIRGPLGYRDPLANLEIDAFRPINNLLWGYVQDEAHRLSIARRVCEYKHQYGLSMQGKAVPKTYTADDRSKFIEAFHHLLNLSAAFFKQDDDTTVNADGFPLLNALREVSLILAQGAHNQFGDLPSTARQEMLIQQWLLSRPEFREFLPTRLSLAYNEPWMDRVDAMKSVQGWGDVSTDHFHRLGVFGEQLLLSVRFGAWMDINQGTAGAANWARFWRSEIQGYIHDYRAVTGVDLTSSARIDSTPPSVHLYRRYREQIRR